MHDDCNSRFSICKLRCFQARNNMHKYAKRSLSNATIYVSQPPSVAVVKCIKTYSVWNTLVPILFKTPYPVGTDFISNYMKI